MSRVDKIVFIKFLFYSFFKDKDFILTYLDNSMAEAFLH